MSLFVAKDERRLPFTGIEGASRGHLTRKGGACTVGGSGAEVPAFELIVEADDALEQLTPDSRQIVVMIAAGYTYREVAGALGVSQRKVAQALKWIREVLS